MTNIRYIFNRHIMQGINSVACRLDALNGICKVNKTISRLCVSREVGLWRKGRKWVKMKLKQDRKWEEGVQKFHKLTFQKTLTPTTTNACATKDKKPTLLSAECKELWLLVGETNCLIDTSTTSPYSENKARSEPSVTLHFNCKWKREKTVNWRHELKEMNEKRMQDLPYSLSWS